jgi:hypothetical protein
MRSETTKKIGFVNRIENNRLPKRTLQYQAHGKRDIGRPRKRRRKQDLPKANELHRTGLTAFNLQHS